MSCGTLVWRGAVSAAGIGVGAQSSVQLDFAPAVPKVRFDRASRASNRYVLEHVVVVRIGPNTLGNAVVDGVSIGGAADWPGYVGVPQSTAGPLIPIGMSLDADWNPRTITVTFTNQSSVGSTFQVAAAVRDLGPDDGYDPREV